MGLYRKACYAVEDVFVKMLTKKKDPESTKVKVLEFRERKEAQAAQKKLEKENDIFHNN